MIINGQLLIKVYVYMYMYIGICQESRYTKYLSVYIFQFHTIMKNVLFVFSSLFNLCIPMPNVFQGLGSFEVSVFQTVAI